MARISGALTRIAAPPEDRCGGGKRRYKTANLRLGKRGTTTPAAAEAELFRSQLAEGPYKGLRPRIPVLGPVAVRLETRALHARWGQQL